MTLVPTDDRVAVRVGPKVFADVPSAAEVSAVRRSRGALLIWVVLLAGMLLACFAVLAFTLGNPAPEVAQLEEMTKQRDEQQQLATRLQGQVNQLGSFARIAELERQTGEARREIDQVPPQIMANARRLIPARDWAPYDRPYVFDKEAEATRVDSQMTKLRALQQRIEALPLPSGVPCDPRDPGCR